MNDLISRQWLMECVEEGWIKFDTEKDENRFIHLVRDIAPSAQPETHWIPCSERLPETDEDGYSDKVLVCFVNFTGCEICEYREDDDHHGWYVGDSDDNPEDIGVHVIAWMPLPEPYAERRTDGN